MDAEILNKIEENKQHIKIFIYHDQQNIFLIHKIYKSVSVISHIRKLRRGDLDGLVC